MFLTVDDEKLVIKNLDGDTLAAHKISRAKGKLIKLSEHKRDRNSRITALRDKTLALLGIEFEEFLTILCDRKPRYVKEQMGLVVQACETYGRENVLVAMQYCKDLEIYSANDLLDAAATFSDNHHTQQSSRLPVEDERYHIYKA